MIHAASLAVLLAAASPALAQHAARKCTSPEAVSAATASDHLANWTEVHRFYQQFGHCFDGAVAGNASDKIQVMLAERWSELPQLLKYTSEDSQFKQFILNVVASESFPKRTFATVLSNAEKQCPKNATEFCKSIKSAGKRAQ